MAAFEGGGTHLVEGRSPHNFLNWLWDLLSDTPLLDVGWCVALGHSLLLSRVEQERVPKLWLMASSVLLFWWYLGSLLLGVPWGEIRLDNRVPLRDSCLLLSPGLWEDDFLLA